MAVETKTASFALWPTHVYIFTSVLSKLASAASKQLLLSNEYGKDESVEQLRSALLECDPSWTIEVVPISLETTAEIVGMLAKRRAEGQKMVVVNLCDGTETDGYPGVSVVDGLHAACIPYTGADRDFYVGTTSKPVLKQKLIAANVATSPFVEIREGFEKEDFEKCQEVIKEWPMIIKPSISYASMSISDRSVVKSPDEAIKQIHAVFKSDTGSGVFVEAFLAGREFTALCTGSEASHVTVYPVAERVFNTSLKKEQRLLAFDRYWDGYDLNGPQGEVETTLYWYALAPDSWQESLADLARRAYIACGGNGYGRVDIRTRSLDKPDAMVLEVNANCGLSFGPSSSSLAEILILSKVVPADFCRRLVTFALERPMHASP
ncbi:hypothetical protein BC831DRAFT_498171 [Entophlyctis helioformis]|nr:hypothetical protein BC831DRAFT_498171 [Entophlyctis helioformis]